MTKQQLITKLTAAYAARLNRASKFYSQDIAAFKAEAKNRSQEQLQRQLTNLQAMADPKSSFNRTADREQRRMEKAGMFDIGNMAPRNALD